MGRTDKTLGRDTLAHRLSVLAVACGIGALGILVGWSALKGLTKTQASNEGTQADIVCGNDGIARANVNELTTSPDGVHFTVWNPGYASILYVPVSSASMPFDDLILRLTPGLNSLTAPLPPNSTRLACVPADTAPDTLDPAVFATTTVEDTRALFTPLVLSCRDDDVSRQMYEAMAAIQADMLDGAFDKTADLTSLVRKYLPGVRDSDEITRALYPDNSRLDAVIVGRQGVDLALIARPLPGDGTSSPLLPWKIITCAGSGIGSVRE